MDLVEYVQWLPPPLCYTISSICSVGLHHFYPLKVPSIFTCSAKCTFRLWQIRHSNNQLLQLVSKINTNVTVAAWEHLSGLNCIDNPTEHIASNANYILLILEHKHCACLSVLLSICIDLGVQIVYFCRVSENIWFCCLEAIVCCVCVVGSSRYTDIDKVTSI